MEIEPKHVKAARKNVPKKNRENVKSAIRWGLMHLERAIEQFQKVGHEVEVDTLIEYKESAEYALALIEEIVRQDRDKLIRKQAKCKHFKTHTVTSWESDDSYSQWTVHHVVCDTCGKYLS